MKEKRRGNKNDLLDQLKTNFADYLQWGEYQSWRHQDFVTLRNRIFEKTKVQLSTTTLKRIFGNLPYTSTPNSQTLDALAQFIDYENWLAYKASNGNREDQSAGKIDHPKLRSTRIVSSKTKTFIAIGVLLAIMVIGVILQTQSKGSDNEVLKTVSFSSQPVAKGFPNTVVFDYDVSQISSNDIVIQQNWDVRKRFKIDKNKFEASSVYYYPGYWKAKLLVDGNVVKEHGIHMKTEGWLSIIGSDPVPKYLDEENLEDEGVLIVSEAILNDIFTQSTSPEILSYNYVSDFKGLSGDDFTMEVSFKNIYDKGAGICQNTGITVMCEEGVIYIPFSIPGCVGNLNIFCSEIEQKGTENNFSGFGVDYSVWNRLKCVVDNNILSIYLNNNFLHKIAYEKPLGQVAGLSFSFTGAGAIDNVLLTNNDGVYVFEEDFNE